jgi:hypothetical protein
LADELLNYFAMMIVVNVMMGDEDASQYNWWGRMDDGSHNNGSLGFVTVIAGSKGLGIFSLPSEAFQL